jgi:type II secretory pathway pseudopilin PulG
MQLDLLPWMALALAVQTALMGAAAVWFFRSRAQAREREEQLEERLAQIDASIRAARKETAYFLPMLLSGVQVVGRKLEIGKKTAAEEKAPSPATPLRPRKLRKVGGR